MSQKLTFYPLGNAESCLLELSDGSKLLFDYADMHDGTTTDERIKLKEELASIDEFKVVMFSHAHEDHTKGASEFFYLDHADKYQSNDRAKINELWVSAAFIMETDLENQSDAKIIRAEARHRLKNGYGIKVFAVSDSLKSWLEKQDITYENIKHLIVHAGETLTIDSEEIEFFIHAPFSDDSDDVQDKNDPSIVMQIRLFNDERETNILMTGDTPYTVLDKIVDISKSNDNDSYLIWDIYDIPHHCSRTGLSDETKDVYRITPIENVQWLLEQAQQNAKMVASCSKITEDTSPPHLNAKRAYEFYTNSDVDFFATMENVSFKGGKPSPIVFEIDQYGVTKKSNAPQASYFKSSAPRAGKKNE